MPDQDAVKNYELSLETLTGDVRDALLTHIRAMEDPWSKLSEAKQSAKISAIENLAHTVVRRAVQLVAGEGFDHVLVKIGKLTISEKGSVASAIECTKSEDNVVHLMARQNAYAVLVLCDPADYFGERDEAKPEPDEPEIPLDDEAQEPTAAAAE